MGRNGRAISLAVTVVAATLAVTAVADVRMGPYLQSRQPGEVSVCVVVEPGDTVQARLDEASEAEGVRAADAAPTCASFAGLKPDVEYRYEVSVNGRRLTGERQSFVAASTRTANVVILGDTRSGDDSFDLAHRQIAGAIETSTVPDAIVHTGDFVERGDSMALWENFFRIESRILTGAPIFPAIGRSDQPGTTMRRLFPVLSASPWYSFDQGPAHFAVLNLWRSASQPDDETSADGAQARWLRRDLADARKAGARYLFAIMHEPAVDVDGSSPRAIREVFMPVFEAFGVTAVFSGAHAFSHAVRRGVHYLTNGGGGAVLETRRPADGAFLHYDAVHHFLVLEVDPAGAGVRAVNASGTDFYSVRFDNEHGGVRKDAPTLVETFGGGPVAVPLTLFILAGCDDCARARGRLEELAADLNVTLVVTLRSADDPDNRARLEAIAGPDAPVPVVSVGDTVLAGGAAIEESLEPAILGAAGDGTPSTRPLPWILPIAAATAGLIALASLFALIRSRRR